MQRSHIVDIECNWKNNQASLTFFSFSCILVYFFCLISLILSYSCQISFNFFQQNSPWPAITCLYFKFIFISERNIFLNKEYEQLLSEICFISKYFPKADSLYFYCYTILLFFLYFLFACYKHFHAVAFGFHSYLFILDFWKSASMPGKMPHRRLSGLFLDHFGTLQDLVRMIF